MKQFFKMFFASLLALVVASFLSIWFFIAMITAVSYFSSYDSPSVLEDVTVFEINISG